MNPVKRTSFQFRLLCSILAIVICWFFAGLVFTIVVHGPGTLTGWLIWGTAFCLMGWVFVGLPVATSREWVFRARLGSFVVLVGFCGGLVMALPYLAWVFTQGFGAGITGYAPQDTFWRLDASAFLIAATSSLIYRGLVNWLARSEPQS